MVDSILKPFQRFGVHFGLEQFSSCWQTSAIHHPVPVIHVAGTNGKGSVCAPVFSADSSRLSGRTLYLTPFSRLD